MYQKGQVDMQKLRHQVLISHPLEKNIFGKRVMCIRKTNQGKPVEIEHNHTGLLTPNVQWSTLELRPPMLRGAQQVTGSPSQYHVHHKVKCRQSRKLDAVPQITLLARLPHLIVLDYGSITKHILRHAVVSICGMAGKR